MIAKHTPGPWKHVTSPRPFGGPPWEVVEDGNGNPLGEFYGDEECNAANARLAAAAPDLLAVARILAALDEGKHGRGFPTEEDCAAARAAIAKAEGAE